MKQKNQKPQEQPEKEQPEKSIYENVLIGECEAAINAYKKMLTESSEPDKYDIHHIKKFMGPFFFNSLILEILEPADKLSGINEKIFDTIFPPAKESIKTEGITPTGDITLISNIPRPDFDSET